MPLFRTAHAFRRAPARSRRRVRPLSRRAGAAAGAGLVGAAFAVGALPLLANGGTLRLASVPMGEYRVSVFTDPTPVRPDSLDVSVLVLEEDREGVAADVEVQVRAEALEGEPDSREVTATREQADDPRYRAAKFALGRPGPWRITIAVAGPRGRGEAAFEVTAREPGLLGHPLLLTLLALLPLGLLGWWLLRDEPAAGSSGGISPGAPPGAP